MKALVIGATGATGKDLTDALLKDAAYDSVVIFARRHTGIVHPKLEEVITDFSDIESLADQVRGDVFFSVLGTTLKQAGGKDQQWKIDYEIPLQFAMRAKKNGVASMVLLSAYGASTGSRVFYSKMKGQLEEAIGSLGFNRYIIFRPGLLLRKGTDRNMEKVSASVLHFLNGIGIAKKFKPLPTELLAQKMAKSALVLPTGKHVIALDKIFEF